jgi:hypothetical protein
MRAGERKCLVRGLKRSKKPLDSDFMEKAQKGQVTWLSSHSKGLAVTVLQKSLFYTGGKFHGKALMRPS